MIFLSKNNNTISLRLHVDLLNTSSRQFDLAVLKRAIISQLAAVYHASIGKYSLDIDTNIHILQREAQCSPKTILFQVVDTISGDNPAEADFKGLRIKLNKNALEEIMANRNTRTIPHELGHLLGWDHPHARGTYESVNPEAHPLEKQLTEDQRKHNLMSQGWYAQKALIPLDKAMQLTEKQIELLLLNYGSGQLNRNFHLKYFLFWSRLIP